MTYAHRRKVFGKRLIDSEVIRNKVRASSWLGGGRAARLLTLLRAVRSHGARDRVAAGLDRGALVIHSFAPSR